MFTHDTRQKGAISRLSERQFVVILCLLLIAITATTTLLIRHAYDKLSWQFYNADTVEAEAAGKTLKAKLSAWAALELARSTDDYHFSTPDRSGVFHRSPLVDSDREMTWPGTTGYFEVSNRGEFTSPILPSDADATRVGQSEYRRRFTAAEGIRNLLQQHLLDQWTEPYFWDWLSQIQFTGGSFLREPSWSLRYGRDFAIAAMEADQAGRSSSRRNDKSRPKQVVDVLPRATAANKVRRIKLLLPIATSRPARPSGASDSFFFELGDEHFSLVRKVTDAQAARLQGVLIDRNTFYNDVIRAEFTHANLTQEATVGIYFHKDIASAQENLRQHADEHGLLYSMRLDAPFDRLEVTLRRAGSPYLASRAVLHWLTTLVTLVIGAGFVLIYRLGIGQLRLIAREEAFISSVSHELRTPITSIRMYGEILKNDLYDEQRVREIYDYICAESDRLGRLVANVLATVKIAQHEPRFACSWRSVTNLIAVTLPRLDMQLQVAKFRLKVDLLDQCKPYSVWVDEDAFIQVLINLIDNAIKYSRGSGQQCIDLYVRCAHSGQVEFSVRDYGPGIRKGDKRHIFRRFYPFRRVKAYAPSGTGIGLYVSRGLIAAMSGSINVRNSNPGAIFTISLRASKSDVVTAMD